MMISRILLRSVLMLVPAMALSSAQADDWPMFRGPQNDGVSAAANVPAEWGPDQNVAWKVNLPGPGNGSPIVFGDRVYVTSATDDGHSRNLHCFDADSGDELWQVSTEVAADEPRHKTNPHAPTTPAADDKGVIVWHGTGGLAAYRHDGSEHWVRDLGTVHHIWGYGTSPILYEDMVILLVGPGERTILTALDRETGETVWEVSEPGGNSGEDGNYVGAWATPLVVQVDGKDQLLVGLPSRVAAFDPQSGEELWHVDGLKTSRAEVIYASPLAARGIGVAFGGFGGPAMGFRLGGSGDVTDSNRLWYQNPEWNPQRIGSGVIVDGFVYMANADNPGSIQCLDLETGEERWQVRRTPEGPHWGSIVYADGRLYVTGGNGITRVFEPDPNQHTVIAENDLGEPSNSTPAIVDGRVYLRTFDHLYCIANK